jgi:hypothetical protein
MDASGFRGEPLAVVALVQLAGGGAAPGLALEVQLRPVGGGPGRRLGVFTTDIAGRVEARLTVPGDLELGDYRVVLVTRGDDQRLGSSTE